ncbi:serine/threonine protein kinase [Serinibacter arcticus]|uniref:Serine/threonine protein kinase n=1 Tax=Serinibacter arcticus TaxID=1655435 RepID=A0A2U1ZZR8_9MICO|nr:serine/threonine-protein kinase [Serinibacter arcticus]PWD52478.1 serine/threonine protein kinase [Serinibacter arcticus]
MGDVFAGRYELVDPLAEGGSGVVWRAWDRRNETYVAAKVLRQVDAASLVRFMREQSLRVAHAHVLAPTGWAGEDDRVLLTMPIVRGGSVATLVGDHGPLPLAWVATLLDQVLEALEVIHVLGLVHRDVKPANLLLDATGTGPPHLWLADFGVATSVDEPRLTQGPYALGTPGYLAPECLVVGWEPHPAADVYAAGMCALEMLVGRRPPSVGGVVDGDVALLLDEAPALSGGVDAAGEAESRAATLRALVLELTSREPGVRPTATAARERLVGLRPADGGDLVVATSEAPLDDVEVFDQLPPLPEGWGDGGRHAPTSAAPSSTAPALPTPPSPTPPDQPGATERVVATSARGEHAGAARLHGGPAGAVSPMSTPTPTPTPDPARSSVGPAVALVLGGILLIVAAILAFQI